MQRFRPSVIVPAHAIVICVEPLPGIVAGSAIACVTSGSHEGSRVIDVIVTGSLV
jgi:hypothetical protein